MPSQQTLTPPVGRWTILSAFWGPVGAIYLLTCLGGLAAGLWPDAIYPSSGDFRPAPLPVLHTLAVAQVGFFLLVYPIVLFRRNSLQSETLPTGRQVRNPPLRAAAGPKPCLPAGRYEIFETLGLFLATVPFYVAAGWVADATVVDCLRTGIAVAAICPLGWVAGRLLARPAARGPVLAGLLGITIGLPGLYYIFRDFLRILPAEWMIWYLSPVTFVWSASAARNSSLFPEPIWAFLIWPCAAAIGALICTIAPRKNG